MIKTQTVDHPQTEQALTTDDPFIYGWRYEIELDDQGQERYVQVPLTLEDIRHPQEDDHRMHSYDHEKFCRYLANVFEAQLADRPEAAVLADVRTAWDKPGAKPNTPDISVVFGIKEMQNWRTFSEAEEGTRPSLVVEITSPTTRRVDLVDKLTDYEYAEVAYYIIVDKYQWHYRLLGYQWTPGGYISLPLNERGWLWLEPVQVWLAWQEEQLACFNERGELILDYADIARQVETEMLARKQAEDRAQQAEDRAQAEVQARKQAEDRAQQAENRLRELEAELRRLKKAKPSI